MIAPEVIPLDRSQYVCLARVELDLSPSARPTKTYIGRKGVHWCRICGRSTPRTTFRTRAHLIPKALGNRELFTNEECDECNTALGSRLEDDLVKLLGPVRPFLPVRTAPGGATHRVGRDGSVVETARGPNGDLKYGSASIVLRESDRAIAITQTGDSSMDIRVAHQPFRPAGVVKALARMGLHVSPPPYLPQLISIRRWIRDAGSGESVLAAGMLPGGGITVSRLDVYLLRHPEIGLPAFVVFYNVGDLMLAGFCPAVSGSSPTRYPIPAMRFLGHRDIPPKLRLTFIPAPDMAAVEGSITLQTLYERRGPASEDGPEP